MLPDWSQILISLVLSRTGPDYTVFSGVTLFSASSYRCIKGKIIICHPLCYPSHQWTRDHPVITTHPDVYASAGVLSGQPWCLGDILVGVTRLVIMASYGIDFVSLFILGLIIRELKWRPLSTAKQTNKPKNINSNTVTFLESVPLAGLLEYINLTKSYSDCMFTVPVTSV